MKKIIIMVLGLLIPGICHAAPFDSRDNTKQMSSGVINPAETNNVIKATNGKIFSVTIIAKSAGGFIEVFDAKTVPSDVDSDMMVELYEGTVNNSKTVHFFPYLQATKGIVISTVNAEAIVTYY